MEHNHIVEYIEEQLGSDYDNEIHVIYTKWSWW